MHHNVIYKLLEFIIETDLAIVDVFTKILQVVFIC
jgi:hypothetical protein